MRTLFGVGMVLALFGVSAADDKIDAKKLLGKWEHKEMKFVVEFLKDGKLKIAGGDLQADGTYKLDGNKISLSLKLGDDEKKMTRTITKLTDTELTSKDDESGKEDTLTRVKEEKKKEEKKKEK